MKKVLIIALSVLFITACDINVKNEDKTKTDSLLQRADTTLEKLGDSAKEKFKDAKSEVKEEWNEHFGKDSASKKVR
jgi:outer membrane protein assembly factor BamD (BamD/ComL family)